MLKEYDGKIDRAGGRSLNNTNNFSNVLKCTLPEVFEIVKFQWAILDLNQ